MNIPELSINRHVLTWMLSGVIILFGIVSYKDIGIDRYPNIDFPMISVTTTMIGANPEIIDASITNIIESAVNSTPGIDNISSKSSPGASVVVLKFKLSKDVDIAFNEVQAKVSQVRRELPEDADQPIVAKIEFGAAPVLWVALQGDRTLQQLNQYARNVIKKRLENIDGVGEVRIGGKRERTIRVNVFPGKMAAFGITTQDLYLAFQAEHVKLPGGFLVSRTTEDLLKLDLEFHSVKDLKQLVVAHREGAPVRLGDIADVEDGLEDFRKLARFNDEPAVSLGIVKVSGVNTVVLVNAVMERLDNEIIPNLPPGMRLEIAVNDGDIIQEIVDALEEHLLLGTLLAALVVLLFLKNMRSTFIIATAIPVSLLGAVVVMYFAGFTFNTMTGLGLLLLIGVVVDDAIVVLENIYRYREETGADARQAALIGTSQVGFAVLAATFTLVSIFVPVVFMGGVIGRFFQSFSVVVTCGVLTSLFVALTLTPMLCSRYLKVEKKHGPIYRFLEAGFQAMDWLYRRQLGGALRFRWLVIIIAIGIVVASFPILGKLGKGFMPEVDEGRFLINFKTPLGSSLAYTDGRLREIEKILAGRSEIASYLSTIGTGVTGQVNQGTITVRLRPEHERSVKQYDLIPVLRAELAEVPGIKAFPAPVSVLGGQRGEPLQFILSGPNLQEVADHANTLLEQLSQDQSLGRVDLDLQLDMPQLRLEIDRTRAADLGISSRDIGFAINVLSGGMDVAKYNDEPGDGERYDIRLKAGAGEITSPKTLNRIYLRSKSGELVRLDTVAAVRQGLGPAVIPRYNLQYAANFYATPSVALGTAVTSVEKAAQGILPPGFALKMTGRAEEFAKTVGYIGFTFGMSILLVYMVLASQFNSFIQPLIIMVAQPLAIIGGLFGLWIMQQSLNIYSMIGLVLLMGLVAKNSILLIDLTNQLRQQGMTIGDALRTACPQRLRPVLMTSITVVLAMLPAAMGVGAGSETNGPMAVAVIGGMISSTLLTLVVVPSVYSLVENGLERWHNFRSRRKQDPGKSKGED